MFIYMYVGGEVVTVGNRFLYKNNVDLKESISCFTLTIS